MRWAFLLLFVVAAATFGFGVWGAQQTPVVVRYTLVLPGLSAPLRTVQLSDSHASRIDMPPERLAAIVAQANALRPDMIVLTGDYVSGNPDHWTPAQTRTALAPFRALRAPLGVFASLGNHDDLARTAAALAGSAVQLLVGTGVDAGPLHIVGADEIDRGSPAVEAMRRAIRTAPPGKPVVVIAHQPTFFTWLQARPVVMFTGHTHGGQIKLPIIGAFAINAYYAAHQRGVFRRGVHRMVVSSGLGTTGLPIRICVPPEIVEVTLLPASAKPGDVPS